MPVTDSLIAYQRTKKIDEYDSGNNEYLGINKVNVTGDGSTNLPWIITAKWGYTGQHSNVKLTNFDSNGSHYDSIVYQLNGDSYNEFYNTPNAIMYRNSTIEWVNNNPYIPTTAFKMSWSGVGYTVLMQNGSPDNIPNPANFNKAVIQIDEGYKISSGSEVLMSWRVNGIVHKTKLHFDADYPSGSCFDISFSLGGYANNYTSWNIKLNPEPAEEPKVYHDVVFHLEHATVTPNDSQLEQGEHTWNFTADDGYIFTKTGGVKNPNTGMYGAQIPATNTNTTSLTYNLTRDIEVRLQATPVPVSDLPVNLKGSHISEYPETVKRDATTITLKAESGYLFKSDTTTNYMAGDNVLTSIITPASETDTLTINLTPISSNVTSVEINSLPVKPDAPTGGYLHTYRVSTQQLNQLSNDLIWNYTGSESAYDVTRYINSIIEYPFVPADDFVSANISLGNKKSSVIASEYRSQYYLFNVGSIQVLPTYHNSYDYNVNDATLYLPYMPAVKLPIGKIMNRVIKIHYRINVSTGDTTVLIYADESLIHNFNGTLGHKVPFVNDMKNLIKTDNTFMFDNGIKQAYIEINQNTPNPEVEWYSDNKVIKGSELTSGRYQAKLNSTPVSVPIEDYNILEKYLEKGFIL